MIARPSPALDDRALDVHRDVPGAVAEARAGTDRPPAAPRRPGRRGRRSRPGSGAGPWPGRCGGSRSGPPSCREITRPSSRRRWRAAPGRAPARRDRARRGPAGSPTASCRRRTARMKAAYTARVARRTVREAGAGGTGETAGSRRTTTRRVAGSAEREDVGADAWTVEGDLEHPRRSWPGWRTSWYIHSSVEGARAVPRRRRARGPRGRLAVEPDGEPDGVTGRRRRRRQVHVARPGSDGDRAAGRVEHGGLAAPADHSPVSAPVVESQPVGLPLARAGPRGRRRGRSPATSAPPPVRRLGQPGRLDRGRGARPPRAGPGWPARCPRRPPRRSARSAGRPSPSGEVHGGPVVVGEVPFQIANSLSMTTGYSTPSACEAWRTLSRSCSKPNSGACTPTMTSPRSR